MAFGFYSVCFIFLQVTTAQIFSNKNINSFQKNPASSILNGKSMYFLPVGRNLANIPLQARNLASKNTNINDVAKINISRNLDYNQPGPTDKKELNTMGSAVENISHFNSVTQTIQDNSKLHNKISYPFNFANTNMANNKIRSNLANGLSTNLANLLNPDRTNGLNLNLKKRLNPDPTNELSPNLANELSPNQRNGLNLNLANKLKSNLTNEVNRNLANGLRWINRDGIGTSLHKNLNPDSKNTLSHNLANVLSTNLANELGPIQPDGLSSKLNGLNPNLTKKITPSLANGKNANRNFKISSGSLKPIENKSLLLQIVADALEIKGKVSVSGKMPVYGSAHLNGKLPSQGTATVNYES